MIKSSHKPRLLTGDTPTGRLHLGHWVGSVENRVALQEDYDCYFLLANTHAFTTRVDQPAAIRQSTIDITLDYLAAGIDPDKSVIFIESDVPAIFELAAFFSMLIPFPRLMRNPTIKDEIRDKELGDNYSMGFLLYPILQVADILAIRAQVVPVGEDQIPHLEMTREVARRFNQMYCGVDSHTEDKDYPKAGGLFPIPETKVGRVRRLVGTGGPGKNGQLLKMSKSLNNAIFLSDPPDRVQEKIMNMYTDPKRLRATDPGTVENNPLWVFHDTFNPDKNWVDEAKTRYREGRIGDVECKKRLVEVLLEFLNPIQQRRAEYENDFAQVQRILNEGAQRVNEIADETLRFVRKATKQQF
ncbi:tryptophan--tRNA ligase [Coxiella burnetii]|uniref:Tryptophan--tRNA ligase n=2 Tax=Coxiella burnetii TaxID=777 RepID=Q83A61_COXBU|nr:tryptophan--tRNA ligase [Coxiella burnetii]NP_821020.1 tryptophan--tRNA ligase [Coxiella burnetii RSA 493]AAO91534.1 tryptophanyl-tRNA synthetase [Coxiella burnetii RSA 493]ABS78119.1 tryptophanyl-tRNA synthetase [Coxiella burnetii Dugway 5J108-111]ABX78319.1 tryptophanyl-tRNA synthetase [Coxiella burnetii RSA 331]ACJ21189.1 tryptophanyl-tRNA synthetase [Coxiella burnetii CbuK_Q154]AIT64264.1 Tryptophan--tRNA ligase [Coxiella burnetii str. Namibia]